MFSMQLFFVDKCIILFDKFLCQVINQSIFLIVLELSKKLVEMSTSS